MVNNRDYWLLLTKVAFHTRHTGTAFCGLLTRLSSNIPFNVVTEDRAIYKPKASELGKSYKEATVTRRLLESIGDRMYLAKRHTNDNDPKLDADISLKQETIDKDINIAVLDNPAIPHHTQYYHRGRPEYYEKLKTSPVIMRSPNGIGTTK